MKRKRIEEICSPDGSALYVNGKLISNWFTVGMNDVLKSCGVKITKSYLVEMFHHEWPKTMYEAKRKLKFFVRVA